MLFGVIQALALLTRMCSGTFFLRKSATKLLTDLHSKSLSCIAPDALQQRAVCETSNDCALETRQIQVHELHRSRCGVQLAQLLCSPAALLLVSLGTAEKQ